MSGGIQGQPTVYHVGLATGEAGVEAIVFDLPGCQCVAADDAAVRELVPVVIAEHIAWLDEHGDVTRDAFPFEFEVCERVDVRDWAEPDYCFDDDLRPVSVQEVETAIRRLGYARQDLLQLIRPLPNAVLDWEPPISALAGLDFWAPEVRSIRAVLNHVAGAEAWKLRNLNAVFGDTAVPAVDLFETRRLMLERLRSLTEEERSGVVSWAHRGRVPGRWTVRKALRGGVHHERFHTKEIEQRLAWLLLGAPGK